MDRLPLERRIASAFVRTHGKHGDLTAQAHERGVHRQTIYREARWVERQLDCPDWQQERQALLQQNHALRDQVAQLQEQLAQRVVLDEDRQTQLASAGQAMGVSLPILRQLLLVLFQDSPQRAPSVAKLGRWTKAMGAKSAQLLQVLDEHTKPLVEHALADEVYTNAAVLMIVEPESMCWVTGKMNKVTGQAWHDEFKQLPHLQTVTRDAGKSLGCGVKLLNQARQSQDQSQKDQSQKDQSQKDQGQKDQGQKPVADQLDHFHSLREGGRAVGRAERAAKRAFTKAEAAEKERQRRSRQGQSLQGIAPPAPLWRRAEKAMDAWIERERLWRQAKAALLLVTPEGTLNTRERAEKLLTEALRPLPDKDFAKSKRLLQKPQTLSYLDEVQRKIQAVEVPQEIKEAAVQQECLRRRPELLKGDSVSAAALRGVLLVNAVLLTKAGPLGVQAIEQVQSIFRQAWRASSLVECLNSVVRMHQARHRKMSQSLLDLKRLHWNCHTFRTGRRRRTTPYERLGVKLPPGVTWWQLLKWPPEQLREKLSAATIAD